MKTTVKKNEIGFSLVEMIATLTLVSIMMGIGVAYIRGYENHAESGALELSRYFRQTRARAMSATLAYKIAPVNLTTVGVRTGSTCSTTTWSDDDSLILDLPQGVELTAVGWSICYTPRGMPSSNETVSVVDTDGDTQSVEVMLGGGVRIF